MRYSICVIDDKIPASGVEGIRDSDLLNASNLQMMLRQETLWTDEVIKNLVRTLLEQKDVDNVTSKWDVYGFTNPSFFINTLNSGLIRFDIIVFDWEYPGTGSGAEIDPEGILMEILKKTFCLVFIFSGADKEGDIKTIIDKPEFQEYRGRLEYLNKSENNTDQTNTLLQKAETMYANNFSFKFASVLRKKAVQGADQILSDMGRASLNDVKNHVAAGDGGKKDFIDFLTERFRTFLAGKDVYDLVDQIPGLATGTPAPDESLAAKLWSYRLYFHPETGDDLVRRGDIVKVSDSFRLVLSADCDLSYFWKKNLGIINTIVLHELEQANTSLKDLLTLCVEPDQLTARKLNNLLDRIGNLAEGPFILPFVPTTKGTKNFVAVPKDMLSDRVAVPGHLTAPDKKKEAAKESMKYSYWPDAERICTISEPFLTPLAQHILNIIGGNGVPDYPEHMREILKKILDDFNTAGAAIAAPLTPPTT